MKLVAALTIAVFAMTGAATAQYKATGPDGITASPKHREVINNGAANTVSAAPASRSAVCPSCKDEYTTRVDTSERGAIKRTVLVAKHLCSGCKTEIKRMGVGKAASQVATHECNVAPAENPKCCVTNKT
ncbi:MAG TPA: hypothetical protein GYA07_09610 [Verrucomicrobia bacterium]|nr:hypothetical protein [Verrucomicrobiota bacterium]HOB31521.1 hypothetical protein [Verrucomicrobiota bacterium]HOP98840.1 hypothetical protein [Verrucomicrobiota bacterium]